MGDTHQNRGVCMFTSTAVRHLKWGSIKYHARLHESVCDPNVTGPRHYKRVFIVSYPNVVPFFEPRISREAFTLILAKIKPKTLSKLRRKWN